eukprot:TRINITY_DN7267_c0_g1_i1.p1 TRINITY_DN7267_c0_g1~~TRINITY_DN7267_c0_g1_i1.p1  ORF type:complete len:364 (+),score=140.22 TRINITY_DN7267_c0_g1_i1:107-1093(+)
MCEVKSTFRRLGMEVEFEKHARRMKKDGLWHDISHEFWMVSDPSNKFADNDIIEVWLEDHKWVTAGGNATFVKEEDDSPPPEPQAAAEGAVVSANSGKEHPDPQEPPPEDEGAAEVSRGRGKYLRKFVIEQIYVARQRKCIEGFFWDDTKGKGIHILNDRSAVIYARQTVRKLEHPKKHEIVGAMKKQREKCDKLIREEESVKARIEALEAARKKKAKEIDFSKPSVWGDRRERRKKKKRRQGAGDEPSGEDTDAQGGAPAFPTAGWMSTATAAVLRSLSGPLSACCGIRAKSAAPAPAPPAAPPAAAQEEQREPAGRYRREALAGTD